MCRIGRAFAIYAAPDVEKDVQLVVTAAKVALPAVLLVRVVSLVLVVLVVPVVVAAMAHLALP